ncbi:MAG: trypsin-like peptidase domain-containing protein, partial [Verrucomicrobiota bacterium]
MLVAWGLLACSATNFGSHTDEEVGISPLAGQSSQELSPPQLPEKPGGASRSSGAPPAAPNPSLGSLAKLPAVFRKTTPATLDDLKSIERHVKALAPRLSPAVVAVQIGETTGSGVVISEDGVVLTAAHVCDEPNRNVQFIFPDGRTAHGKTLGTNHEIDAGMMKITEHGPWPHVEMGDLDQVRLGDWVLTLGHPGGFDPERPMVLRLGRIIRLAPEALQTDCTLSAGDSGGPLFDMHGRVIGIHSRISDSTAENFHVPITTFRDTWARLAKGESWGDERPSLRPWFGVRGVDHPSGCKLEFVEEDAPASRAGLKVGDVLRKVNAREVKDYAALKRFVAEAQ